MSERSQVNFKTTQEFLEVLDNWRRKEPGDNIMTRSEAIRLLVLEALEARKQRKKRPVVQSVAL